MSENDSVYGPNPLQLVLLMGEDANGKMVAAASSPLSFSKYFYQAAGLTTQGQASVNGTALVMITIPAGQTLYLTKVVGMAIPTAGLPAALGLKLCEGATVSVPPAMPAAATITNIDTIPLAPAGGDKVYMADGFAVLDKIINPSATLPYYVFLYAPHVFGSNAANDAATNYYESSWAGVIL
jgi:hypothetical protein